MFFRALTVAGKPDFAHGPATTTVPASDRWLLACRRSRRSLQDEQVRTPCSSPTTRPTNDRRRDRRGPRDLLRSLVEDEDGDHRACAAREPKSFPPRRPSHEQAGLIVELDDGSEFHVSVTQSRIGDIDEAENDHDTP